jgi:hypothetical protein
MLRNRAIFVLIALVILPGRASLAEVFSADKRNNPLAGLVYSNEKIGGCQASHVAISETAAEIKLNGIIRTLPVHGMKVIHAQGTQEEIVSFQIDFSENEDELWWTMVFIEVTTPEAADKEVDWNVQAHTSKLSYTELAAALVSQPGRYFGRLSAYY